MRIVFMGTPDFAVPALESLYDAGHEIVAVFTQPDKPRGRKQQLTPPEVKQCALSRGLTVYQPSTLRDDAVTAQLTALSPDIIVVAAYGKILPKAILDIPPLGCVNIHASLLPKYRGAAPIQHAVLNGERETGVTIMQMAEGLDTGDILLQRAIPIATDDTSASMFDKLSALGASMIVDSLPMLQRAELIPIQQDDTLATFAPMLDRSLTEIDWSMPNTSVHDRIRGLYSWPIAQTHIGSKRLKVYRSALSSGSGQIGEVISLSPLTVACGTGSVELIELQLEGKKRMDSRAFLLGHPLDIGTKFGG